jgi:hypothetical protein
VQQRECDHKDATNIAIFCFGGTIRVGRLFMTYRREIDFIITGAPRSGTSYIARILSYLGIECGHESMFNPWEIRYEQIRFDARKWGDSSWLAAPFLEKLPRVTKVFHIVRDPLETINSIIGTGQIDWPSDYRTFLAHHCWGDGSYWPTDIRTAAQEFWVKWNSMIEGSGRVTSRFQVESVGQALHHIVTNIQPGFHLSQDRLKEAWKAVPTTYNTRPKQSGHLLTQSDLKQECILMLKRYGYADQTDGEQWTR